MWALTPYDVPCGASIGSVAPTDLMSLSSVKSKLAYGKRMVVLNVWTENSIPADAREGILLPVVVHPNYLACEVSLTPQYHGIRPPYYWTIVQWKCWCIKTTKTSGVSLFTRRILAAAGFSWSAELVLAGLLYFECFIFKFGRQHLLHLFKCFIVATAYVTTFSLSPNSEWYINIFVGINPFLPQFFNLHTEVSIFIMSMLKFPP